MGFFSWITTDTKRSIANVHSSRYTFTVHMKDDKGNIWTEKNYDGYGMFGGKDFYELLDEMNGGNGDRQNGIYLYFGRRKYNDDGMINVLQPDGQYKEITTAEYNAEVDHWNENIRPKVVKYPSLTQDPSVEWSNIRPEDCFYQGYFYGDYDLLIEKSTVLDDIYEYARTVMVDDSMSTRSFLDQVIKKINEIKISDF